jgi:hypothetical protein
MSGLAHGGPTDSERHGESEARQGWNLPKWIANLASICHYAFSSPRPATIAAALIAVCLLALPACAGAAGNNYEVNTLANTSNPASTCAIGATTTCSIYDATALANTNSGSTITFAPGLTGTIYVRSSSLVFNINANMTILGPGANQLTIDFQSSGSFDVDNVTFKVSGLTLADGNSAVLLTPNAAATIDRCVITGMHNRAVFINSGTSATVTNSLIYGNTTPGNITGAGISNSGRLTVINSTITGNTSASAGGGIENDGAGTITISNSTITGNNAASTGSGNYSGGGGIANNGGAITITNSIVSGNTSNAPNGGNNYADCYQCGTQSAYNIIGGTPPALGPLAWNGGPMKTILPLYGSTAIGAGSYMADGPPTDQRGFPRQTSGAVDLGAVQTHYLTVNTTADANDGTCTLTTCSLRDALAQAANDGQGDIQFSATGTIFLTLAEPLHAIVEDLNIVGPGAGELTIDGGQSEAVGSIFSIGNDEVVAISGVTITHGNQTAVTVNSVGGAITNDGQLTVSNSILSENNSPYLGGTIVNNGEWLIVDNSTISDNTGYYGAIDNINEGIAIVNNSTLSGNSTFSEGGGIWSYGGAVLVNNSTISGNTTGEGGGIYYSCPSSGSCGGVIVNNSTISANVAATAYTAGGIYNATGTNVTLNNSIVAGNAAGGKANSGDCPNCGTQSQYNFIGGNPELTPLQVVKNGTTQAVMIPMPGSPVIGAGSWIQPGNGPTFLNQALYTDERGFSRPTTTSAIDLGAVQSNYTAIEFSTQPSDAAVNQYMVPAPAVTVLETNPSNQNSDGVNGIPVTLAFSGGASEIAAPSTLTATTTAGGLATFGGITVNTTGTGYTFTVATPVLNKTTVTSNQFNVLKPAATPTILPAAGTYNTVQTVTISSTDASAMIYYTTDGSTPTANSTLNRGPITVSTSETINAIGIGPGLANSAIASATYNLMAATPTFSPSGRTFTSVQTVTIGSDTPSATIYYTLDGTTPTTSSRVANAPITVSSSETISAFAVAAGFTNSIVTSSVYTINLPQAATPTFLPAAGTYTSAQSVTISSTDMSAMIYYTTDGSTPTANSTLNRGPITVSASETIKAIAIAPGFVNSTIASAAYNLPISFAVAVTPATLSVTSGQSGTATVSVTSQNLLTAVILTCSGLPAGASCSFSPASVTPSGTAASTSMLTVNTSGETAVLHRNSNPFVPVSTLAAAFSFLGWKKRRKVQLMLLLAVSVIGLSLFTGCGGSSSTSKTPVVSTITVTGTSGTGASQLQNSTTFSLTVN